MKPHQALLLSLLFLCSCASHTMRQAPHSISSLQIIDRNGFSETISAQERLSSFQKVDFLESQPYQKVLRVFQRDKEGKSKSAITTYHPNGQVWQYLEVVNGRAHGAYQEWHPSGQLKISSQVIEGAADVNEASQASWLFDGESKVWDEQGHCLALITYVKGVLSGTSLYYYPNGQLWKTIPYLAGEINGEVAIFNEEGKLCEKIPYVNGLEEGTAEGYQSHGTLRYRTLYRAGKLLEALYYDNSGKIASAVCSGEGYQSIFDSAGHLAQRIQYKGGEPEGSVEIYREDGSLLRSYEILQGKKHGQEREYYPPQVDEFTPVAPQPKLEVFWQEDSLQGIAKTWYPDGTLESQRELQNNKKEGLSLAWYKDGSPSLIEEYRANSLVKGSYFQKGDKRPVSRIEDGKGIATLYDTDGRFVRKIHYEKGKPKEEEL